MLAGATSGNIGACQAAIADVSRGPERIRALGKLGAGIGLGMMLGPWIGGRASTLGEAAPPLAAAILAVAALGGVLLFLPETNAAVLAREEAIHSGNPGASARPRLSMRALASHPKIAVVMGLYFLTFLYMTNLQTALALLAHDRFHWTKEHVGDLFGLFGLCTLLTQFGLVGPISSRVAPAFVAMGAAVLAAVALAWIGVSPVVYGMVGGLVVLAVALGLTQPLLASLASQFAGKDQQGTVLGFAQSSGSLARTVGPLLWGALYQHFGPTASFVGGSIAAICAAVVALGARPSTSDERT
jgi:MFS family permease